MNNSHQHVQTPRLAWLGVSALALALTMGCSSLPASTPEVVGLAADRVEINALAAETALNNAIDNGQISQRQIDAAQKKLDEVDASSLTAEDKQRLAEVKRLLRAANDGLNLPASVTDAPKQVRDRLGDTATALRQVQTILASKVEQEQVIDNLRKRLSDAASSE